MKNEITLGSYKKKSFGEQNYRILDPKEILLHILKYKNFPHEWDIKDGFFVGSQGSGKTSMIRYLIDLITGITDYQERGISVIKTNDVRIISDKRYFKYFQGSQVIILIVDDAMSKGFDSRRSMEGASVDITRFYNTTRHKLEEHYAKNGIIFVFFANQLLSRLDKSIRVNVKFKVFTSYYDQKWFKKLFTYQQYKFMKKACFLGEVGSDFDLRRFNIMKVKSGETSTIEVPMIKEDELIEKLKRRGVIYEEINRSLDQNDMIEMLVDKIFEKYEYPEDVDLRILKSYLEIQSQQIKEDYTVSFTRSDIDTAINRSLYYSSEKERAKEERIKVKDLTMKERLILAFGIRKAKILEVDDLVDITGENRSNIYSALSSYDVFKRVARGVYTLKGFKITEQDLHKYQQEPQEQKMLIM
jgi:hypothetical protein